MSAAHRSSKERPLRLLFVCLGNINRSCIAHWITQHRIEKNGLEDKLEVDSAGTSDYHIGEGADPMMYSAAQGLGYDLSKHRARQVRQEDCDRFDHIIAMDTQNLRDLRELFPKERQDKLSLFSKWDPENTDKYDKRDVPDPYFCGSHANVVKLVEGGVEAIGKKLGLKLDE
eukprot:gb/GECG01013859.1/.p1 GENE.gb/GECG01013859.1/~~gb/GECG01013859.1/.p1  ORF type:complete len:172 (+),score=15.24 gb/GECG01013859.1/:1-516(+)